MKNKIKNLLKNKIPILVTIHKKIHSFLHERLELRHLEFHIVDHCNLKCIACTHFSNISDPNFVDAKKLKLQLKRINKIFNKITRVRILGGEPLLHPDIINILKITRKSLPNSNIELVTNSLLLDKMPEKFFLTCHKNNIKIYISNYPITSNKINVIKKLLSSFKVEYEIPSMVVNFATNLNPNGNLNKDNFFKICRYKYCTILKDDNIYICPICAYIGKYNKYFNKEIPESKGINIFTHSAKQILEYLSTIKETCNYCTFHNYVKWSYSKKPKETDWYGKI